MKKGWPRKALGEVCEFRGGGTPSKSVERYWRGDIPWVSPKDMKFDVVSDSIDHISQEAIDGSATSLIPKDAVLMVVRSGILARTVPIAITGRDLTINQDLKALCPNGEIDARFLYHLLDSRMDELLSMVSRGATVHRLATAQIRALKFVLPPLAEQQRIVGLLDEAFAGLVTAQGNAEKNRQNARALFESHLQSVFSGRGKGLEEKRLDALYRIGSSKRVLKAEWKTEGVPFYRGREVTRLAADGFVDNELFISEAHFAELSREYGVPKAGDIVITAIGTIGNSHVVRSSDRFYFKDASVLWMKRIAEVSSEFIRFWLKSSLFCEQLDRGNGATVDTLTIQKLQSVELLLPRHEEQLKIVAQLDALSEETQRLARIYERKLAALVALKKSLQHQAFAGNL